MKKTQNTEANNYDSLVEELRDIIAKQEKALENERMKSYALMSEVIRLRRVGEIFGEERDECIKRAERAERGLRNLRKWLQISGIIK